MVHVDSTGFHHRQRFEGLGHAHYLTFSCFQNRRFLSSKRTLLWFVEALRAAREKNLFDLWAWVAMPEHAHVLVWPRPGVTVSRILSALKQPVSKRALVYLRRGNSTGLRALADVQPSGEVAYRFWQRGGGYDRNIFTAAEVREKIGYIHANPVRRALVRHPSDWPWSSWPAWTKGTDEPVPVDRQSVPPLGR